MISIYPNQVFELPAEPLTPPLPPPRSIYRAYATSVPESDADQSPIVMSSPQLQKMSPPRPIIHQRPLVLRSKQPPSPPVSVSSIASPSVQFQTPSILSPSPTLVATPPPALSPSPELPSQSTRSVPLSGGVSSTTITAATPKPTPTLHPSKSTRTLNPPTDLSLSPSKSLRQKAFEKAQSPSPANGHRRQKPSTGQRMKEGAFFAFVVLPMSCWYTRGGKMLGSGQERPGKGHVKIEDDNDNDSMDSRAPRMIGAGPLKEESMPPRTPTMTRRMSSDGFRRRSSLSSSKTPVTARNGELGRRVSFDGKVAVMRERSNTVDRRDDFERTGSITRERSNTLGRRQSFDGKPLVSRERSNTLGRRDSFDGKTLVSHERAHTFGRRESFDGKVLIPTPTPTSRERANTYTQPLYRRDSFERANAAPTRERANTLSTRQSFDRTGSLTRREGAPPPSSYTHSHSRSQSQLYSQSQMQTPTQRAPMGRREWEWERERERGQDRWKEKGGFGGGNRVISMGMPPPIMVAERWV